MKITETINWKIVISDCETLKSCIDLGFYNPDEDKWYEFEISEYKNDLYSFVKFYSRKNWEYMVFFNGIAFDSQVIQFILNNYNTWFDLKNLEIVDRIYTFTQSLINDQSYSNRFLPFRENQFEIPIIDVFTLLGLNNLARSSSLKKIEFQLDMDNVEELPIHHSIENLTREQIQEIKDYRKNDVIATFILFKLCLGDTDHPLYKGNNQIELRLDIQSEFGIDCLSSSDIAIGDELMKVSYAKQTGKDLKDIPYKGYFRKSIALKDCIAPYIEFQSTELKQLLKETKKVVVKQIDKYERKFKFGALQTEYVIGLGGGHSTNRNEIYTSDEDSIICDLDVGSLYPAILVNMGLFPQHLGKQLLVVYKQMYDRRIELKPLAETDRKIKGITDAIKLLLNSFYGKMGSIDSWAFDKKVAYTICLTGQFSLLMLIERMELEGIKCFYLNTDGGSFILPRDKKGIYDKIIEQWQTDTNLILEEKIYKKMIFSTVNDYIAINNNDKLKKKGDFLTEFELWKNKSYRVIPLALEAYFIHGKDPIEFVYNHKNIFDFCIMARAKGKLYLEEQWEEDNKVRILTHKKLIRYYLSDTGRTLYKRGEGSTGKDMNNHINAPNEIGNQYVCYFNQYIKKEVEDYNIAYNHYVLKTLKIIDAVENTKRAKQFIDSLKPITQLSLFN